MKVWFLVILVYGEVVHSSARPMTAEECAVKLAHRIGQVEQYIKSGAAVPKRYGGANVTIKDVEIKCLRRK